MGQSLASPCGVLGGHQHLTRAPSRHPIHGSSAPGCRLVLALDTGFAQESAHHVRLELGADYLDRNEVGHALSITPDSRFAKPLVAGA
jgi:hypothetical protein